MRMIPTKRNANLLLCAAMACFVMIFCVLPGALRVGGLARAAQAGGLVVIGDEAVPLAGGTKVLKPASPGTVSFSGGGATIDASNADQGYVMIRYSGGNNKVKVQITRSGKATYTYDLDTSGRYEVFPLSVGEGSYTIGVFTNVSGSSYAQALSRSIDVKLENPYLPFLYPNQYINFSAKSKTVAKGAELAEGAEDDLTIVANIYNYVVGNLSYDTQKAKTVRSGYLPAVDNILASKKGICFDYAALMASMLRSQQIPTRLEVGYVSGGAYHAWLSVYIKEVGWVNGIIQFDGKSWKRMDPTFASTGGTGSNIAKYIGNGSNYKTQYSY